MARRLVVAVGVLVSALACASARADVALDETRLPLRLIGTVVAARADRSLAVIESAGATRVVHPGDSIGSATVEEIAKDGIVIANASRRERLSFGAPGTPGAASTSAELARAHSASAGPDPRDRGRDAGRDPEPRGAAARRTTALRGLASARKAAVQRASFETPKSNDDVLADLSRQARFQPLLDDAGKLRGVALLGVLPDSMLERFGLQSGDVVTHVAGVKIDSTANAYNTLRGLNLRDGVELTVVRRGAQTTVNVPPGSF